MLEFRCLSVPRALVLCAAGLLTFPLLAQDENFSGGNSRAPKIAASTPQAEIVIKAFKPASGLKVDLFAAEPMLANPVCFSIDEKGRVYVAETFRHTAGVLDIRGRADWEDPAILKKLARDTVDSYMLDEELALTNHEDSNAMLRRHFGPRLPSLIGETEQVVLITPGPDGKAARSTVFATGFNKLGDGIGAGLLARQNKVWYTCIPDLYLLEDTKGAGKADVIRSLAHGFGVRVGFLGHDLHGLRMGPDGMLYFSVGDRGANVNTKDGRVVYNPEYGAVYRCNPDGSGLEIFAFGLRNPQELVFDEYGNLWTGDNNSDAGDPARWVYVVENGDSGWRVGYQFIESPEARGPWHMERQCYPYFSGQAAFLVPPIDSDIGAGPSGVTYYPGTGLSEAYRGHFFMCDFRGQAGGSGVHDFVVKPKGAYFEMTTHARFIWNILATDVDYGYDGRVYVSDWVAGWNKTGRGRIYRVFDPEHIDDPMVKGTQKLFAEGFAQRSIKELTALLQHPDQRARQEAQFALVERGSAGQRVFEGVLNDKTHQLARIHSIWGLGMLARKNASVIKPVVPLLKDADPEIRAQAAKILGDQRDQTAFAGLLSLLKDESLRVRFFAAISIGKYGNPEGFAPIVEMLREAGDTDPYLRHAGVMGLLGCRKGDSLLSAARDTSPAVRMAALVAMRRLDDPRVALFLNDASPEIVVEAARAINDASIYASLPQLASLITRPTSSVPLSRRVVNANFRLGTAPSAQALAKYSANNESLPGERIEALECLGEWAKPNGRDRLTGLWRPLASRDATSAADALRPVINALLASPASKLRVLAAELAGNYRLTEAATALYELALNKTADGRSRAAALHALGQLNDSRLGDALARAASDSDETLRKEATRLRTTFHPTDATAQLVAVLNKGTVGEQQNALVTFGGLKDSRSDAVLGGYLDKLLQGNVRPELRLDLLEAADKRSNPALKQKIQQYQEAKSKTDALAPYREALYGGDAAEGRKVFFEKPEASCVRCHKIGTEGGEVGPNLSDIGKRQTREYILESMVFPNKQIAPGFDTWLVTLKSGTAYAGTVRTENDQELVLNTAEEGIVKIKKSDIDKRDRGLSGMPEGFGDIIPRRDLRNLVEFMAQQTQK